MTDPDDNTSKTQAFRDYEAAAEKYCSYFRTVPTKDGESITYSMPIDNVHTRKDDGGADIAAPVYEAAEELLMKAAILEAEYGVEHMFASTIAQIHATQDGGAYPNKYGFLSEPLCDSDQFLKDVVDYVNNVPEGTPSIIPDQYTKPITPQEDVSPSVAHTLTGPNNS